MGTGRTLSWAAVVAGVLLLVWAGLQGDLSVHLVLIVPVVTGVGPTAALGMLLLFAGLVGLFWTGVTRAMPPPSDHRGPSRRVGHEGPGPVRALEEDDVEQDRHDPSGEEGMEGRGKRRSAGILLLGPIPIAWGSDQELLKNLLLLVAAVMVLAIIALLLLR